jgi:hypothetical protein
MPGINQQITGSSFRLCYLAVKEKNGLISVTAVSGLEPAVPDNLRNLLSGS